MIVRMTDSEKSETKQSSRADLSISLPRYSSSIDGATASETSSKRSKTHKEKSSVQPINVASPPPTSTAAAATTATRKPRVRRNSASSSGTPNLLPPWIRDEQECLSDNGTPGGRSPMDDTPPPGASGGQLSSRTLSSSGDNQPETPRSRFALLQRAVCSLHHPHPIK